MANTPRVTWPKPTEHPSLFIQGFSAFADAADATAYSNREDRNLTLMGGGTVTFTASSGLLEWSAPLEFLNAIQGVLWTVGAGSVVLEDGQVFYVNLVRGITAAQVLDTVVATRVPNDDNAFLLGVRRDDRVYFRQAVVLDGVPTELGGTLGGGTPVLVGDSTGNLSAVVNNRAHGYSIEELRAIAVPVSGKVYTVTRALTNDPPDVDFAGAFVFNTAGSGADDGTNNIIPDDATPGRFERFNVDTATPSGTGIPHIVAGVQQATASLIVDADVHASAAIAASKVVQATGTGIPHVVAGALVAASSLIAAADLASGIIDDRHINAAPAAAYSNLAFGQRTIKWHAPTGAAGEWLALLQILKDTNVRELRILPGTVLCDSTENMAGYNQKKIKLHDNAIIHSTLAPVDGHSSTPLYWDGLTPDVTTAIRIGTSGLNGAAFATLTASVTRSSADIGRRFTIADTTGLAGGQRIAAVFVSGGTNVFIRTYKVVAIVSGTEFEVDRHIIYPFLVTSGTIYKIALTEDLHIEGGQLEGTGDRLIQVVGAWRSSLRGTTLNSSTTGLSCAFDGGPYDCDWENVRANIIANSNYAAVPFEMGEKLRAKGVIAKGLGAATGQAALAFPSCDDLTLDSCSGQASLRGLQFANNDVLDTYGCHNVTVLGGTYSGNGTGIEHGSYASDIRYLGPKASDNLSAGIRITTTGQRAKMVGVELERNGYNLHVSGGRGHTYDHGRMEGSTSGHLVIMDGASPELSVSDSTLVETTTAGASAFGINGTGTADLRITRTSADITKAGAAYGVLIFTATNLTLDDFEVTKSSGSQGNVVVSGGTTTAVTLKGRSKALGTSLTTGISLGASDTLHIDGDATQLQTITATNTVVTLRGVATQAFTTTNVTLTTAQALCAVLTATGAQTASRDAIFPPWPGLRRTINNLTTGNYAVRAISTSGTGVYCAAGITHVYFDGTNMVNAADDPLVTKHPILDSDTYPVPTVRNGRLIIKRTSGATTAVTLPASPLDQDRLEIKLAATSTASIVTLTPSAGTVEGAATLEFSAIGTSITLVYDSTLTDWMVMA